MGQTIAKTPIDTALSKYGITNSNVLWNLYVEELQKITIEKGFGVETDNGTLTINTGKFTGRSPQDRFIVKDDYTSEKYGGEKSINL